MSIDDRIRDRVAALTGVTGTTVTLRRVTTTGGPAPSTNPPYVGSAQVDANTSAGLSSITISGDLRGRLLAGDAFRIGAGAQLYTVTALVAAASNKFTNVAISPSLQADAIAGQAIAFVFAADAQITARISAFPTRMVDGTAIRSTDLLVIIPGSALSAEPKTSDLLMISGRPHNIVNVTPEYVRDAVGLWRVQARG